MTDWIHCNKCYLRYQQRCKFYLTTCGHIKCEKCVSALGPERQCLVCNAACDVAQLSNNLKPDIQSFFRPCKEINIKQKQIYAFQYENTISILKKITSKYNGGKGELAKRYKVMQALKRQNAQLRMMASSTSRGRFAASTPAAGVLAVPMNSPPNITPIRIPPAVTMQRINDSLTRFMPWNQPRCSGRQQHIQGNSAASRPIPSFGGLQGTTSGRSGGTVTPANPAMTSLSRLQYGCNNGSH